MAAAKSAVVIAFGDWPTADCAIGREGARDWGLAAAAAAADLAEADSIATPREGENYFRFGTEWKLTMRSSSPVFIVLVEGSFTFGDRGSSAASIMGRQEAKSSLND
jgi:hypothetical protein